MLIGRDAGVKIERTDKKEKVHEERKLYSGTSGICCEQWFLLAGRYAMKGEKPLRAAVCFSKLTSLHVKLKFKIAF